jgi:hypothetical protein
MSEEEKELVNNCKLWVTEEDINYTRWFSLDDLSVLVNLIEKQQKEIDGLKNKLRQAKGYIQENMGINDNPTLYTEEDFYKPLPIWLTLEDEELTKLLEMLEV